MKVLLTIFCAAAALFGGGCALVIINSAGPITLLPLGILILNGLILYGLWGAKTAWRPAFYILGVIDLLIAAGTLYFAAALGIRLDGPDVMIYLLPLAFAIKGILTLIYARRV